MTIDNCGVLRMAKIVTQKRKKEFPRRSDTCMYIIMIIKMIKILLEHCLILPITIPFKFTVV